MFSPIVLLLITSLSPLITFFIFTFNFFFIFFFNPMNDNRPFLAQFFSTPPITRALSISIIIIIVCIYIKLVSPYSLMYSPYFLKSGEFWRIFTCFLYFGNPSLDVLIHITFLYRYSRMLEEGFIYTSDYFWLVFIISSLLFFIANLFNIPLLASAFSSTITYIWTRKNPHAIVQIFGFISFPAFYLPFIVPLFMLVTEKKIMTEDLLGIVVGHLYFFFKDVYPKWGADVFRTPCIIKKFFGEHSDECCKKPKYRTLNLNTNQLNPTMETIILEEETMIGGEESRVNNECEMNNNDMENEGEVNINKSEVNIIEAINKEEAINKDESFNNIESFNKEDTINDESVIKDNDNDSILKEESIEKSDISDFSSHEMSRENELSKENVSKEEEKDWEEKWSSETIEDSS